MTVPAVRHSPQFRRGLQSVMRGEVFITPIRAYLMDPKFPAFEVKVDGLGIREPDFWFHPSEHPGWSPRALYLWMTQPELLHREPMEPTAVLSMTAGSIWHAIIGHILSELGLVNALEVPIEQASLRTRGKLDGITKGNEIYELKTMKEARLRLMTSPAEYLRLNPSYHLQANEYMRVSGIHEERVLLMSLTFPYEMKEFIIEYDHRLGQETEEKYARVLQAVADGRMPSCSGCVRERDECPSRMLCKSEPMKVV